MTLQWDIQISIGMINLKHIKLRSGVYINSSFWVFNDLSELFFFPWWNDCTDFKKQEFSEQASKLYGQICSPVNLWLNISALHLDQTLPINKLLPKFLLDIVGPLFLADHLKYSVSLHRPDFQAYVTNFPWVEVGVLGRLQ